MISDSLIIPGLEREENQIEYIDELLLESATKPENEIQLVEQMEILKEEKPENEIQHNEELIILKKEKEPLAIEYLDYVTILVDQKWRTQNKMKKCIIQNIDTIELDQERAEEAKINIDSLNLSNKINLIIGDALDVMPNLKGKYDMIFIDASKSKYPKFLEYSLELLNKNGLNLRISV